MLLRWRPPAYAAVLTASAFTVLSATACHRNRPATTPVPSAGATDQADAEAAARARMRDSLDAAQRARAARDSAELAAQQRAARTGVAARDSAVAARRASLLAPVYFDYDAAELRDDARAALEAKLEVLTAYPALHIRVSGHTDDRGSDEYNLALGARRAASVKRFFTERGVDADRIDVVSFGKERPTCTEDDESCWSRNRRAEFEVVRGGASLSASR